ALDGDRLAPGDARVIALAQLLERLPSVRERQLARLLFRETLADLVADALERPHLGRLVLQQARGNQRAGRDLDHLAVALVLEDVLGEHRLQEALATEGRARRRRARY